MPDPSAPTDPLKGTAWGDLQPTDYSGLAGYVVTATLFGMNGYAGPFLIGGSIAVPRVQTDKTNHEGRWSMELYGNDQILPAGSYWLITESKSTLSKVLELESGTAINVGLIAGQDFPTGGSFTPPRMFFTSTTVRAATTANITIATALNNGDTLDGLTLATGDRVLVKDQTLPAQNGIYVVGATPARSTDFDEWDDVPGTIVNVTEGTANAGGLWRAVAASSGTIGTTSITFASFIGNPLDATLVAFGALTIAANTLTIGTGPDAFSQTPFAVNTFPARGSTGDLAAKPITDFGLGLVDDADAPTARATLSAAKSGANIDITSLTLADADILLTTGVANAQASSNGVNAVLLSNSNSTGNVLAIRNTSASGYSALEFRDSGNAEVGAFGYGNASEIIGCFAGVNYWESANFTGTPPPLALQLTGDFGDVGSGLRFYNPFRASSAGVDINKLVPYGTSLTGGEITVSARFLPNGNALFNTLTTPTCLAHTTGNGGYFGHILGGSRNGGKVIQILDSPNSAQSIYGNDGTNTILGSHSTAPLHLRTGMDATAADPLATGNTVLVIDGVTVTCSLASGAWVKVNESRIESANPSIWMRDTNESHGIRWYLDGEVLYCFRVADPYGAVESTAYSVNMVTSALTATSFVGALTGNASTATALATPRAIYGNNFDGTAALTQVISGTYGGTGVNNSTRTITVGSNFATSGNTIVTNGFTYTLQGANATLARTDAAQTFTGTQTITTIDGLTSLTGAAGNMTVTSGTGNSRTLTLRTTTSGGTATNALVLDATQGATVTGTVNSTAGSFISSASDVNVLFNTSSQAFRAVRSTMGAGSVDTCYFQVGANNDNCGFTARVGGAFTRLAFCTTVMQITNASNLTATPNPVSGNLLELINSSNVLVASFTNSGGQTLGGAPGGVTTATKLTKLTTAIADNTATAVLTVSVPNGSQAAVVRVTLLGRLGAGGVVGADEATGTISYDISVARGGSGNPVATISTGYGSATSNVSGAATITVTGDLSSISGAVGATNTFTVRATIAKGSGSSANHTLTLLAEVLNSNATGITIA